MNSFIYQIGEGLRIDPDRYLLFKHNEILQISDLSFRLLLVLAENAPHVVAHDELIKAVWGDRIVSVENIKQRVSRLRKAIGDNPEKPLYIQVVRGSGYRCIASVEQLSTEIIAKPDFRAYWADFISIVHKRRILSETIIKHPYFIRGVPAILLLILLLVIY